MVKIEIKGENEKITEFLNNLKASNFYFQAEGNQEASATSQLFYISESPGVIPDDEAFSFRGFMNQWISEGLKKCLDDFLYLSDKGTMVSFNNMAEFRKIYDFLEKNFGHDFKIEQMINKISDNNLRNFENSGLIVFGKDTECETEEE